MSGPDPWRRGGGGEEPFEELADGYDSWFDTSAGQMLFDLELGALRPLLAGAPGPGLEVGVGSGRFASALGVDVGVDVAATPLVRAGSRGVSAVRAAGEQLPFAGGVLGAVVLVVTLCFVDDPGGVLAEAGRVLGPDGRLVMGVFPGTVPGVGPMRRWGGRDIASTVTLASTRSRRIGGFSLVPASGWSTAGPRCCKHRRTVLTPSRSASA